MEILSPVGRCPSLPEAVPLPGAAAAATHVRYPLDPGGLGANPVWSGSSRGRFRPAEEVLRTSLSL